MIRRPPVEHHPPDHQSSQEAHAEHGVHGGHAGHAEVFRRRFWVSLILAVPVVLYSQMVMELFELGAAELPGLRADPPGAGLGHLLVGRLAVPHRRRSTRSAAASRG